MARHMSDDEISAMMDRKRGPGRPSPYPWKQWRDGQWWMAEEGVDFTCTPESFRSTLYRQGQYHDLRVEVQVDDGYVHFRFTDVGRRGGSRSKAYSDTPQVRPVQVIAPREPAVPDGEDPFARLVAETEEFGPAE